MNFSIEASKWENEFMEKEREGKREGEKEREEGRVRKSKIKRVNEITMHEREIERQ